jgi:hypothetical protein
MLDSSHSKEVEVSVVYNTQELAKSVTIEFLRDGQRQ